MSALLLISFVAGILTVLAPCVLPLLPVIVGGSVSGETSTRRTLIIVLSLAVSVFAFTLLLKASTFFISIPAVFWQLLSGGLLVLFGVVTLFPSLWDGIPIINKIYRSSNKLLGSGFQKHTAWGDVIIGAALGPVFSSCSPTYFVILAAVLPVHFTTGVIYLLSYVLGLAIFLFIIAYAGQKAVTWLGIASDPDGWFKKIIGAIFIVIGLAVIFGLDKDLEAALPSGFFGEINIEQGLLSSGGSNSTPSVSTSTTGFLSPSEKSLTYQKAPELVHPDGYINTNGQPITLGQFIGKNVVLVDFWDYSCINCQRTFPYLNAWYQKYKDQGLVIIGVHTPEFAFEHLLSNVQAAANQFGLKYPIVLDNEYQTWNAFQNEYWPREYLIDIDGYIVHDHAGEGEYDVTEQAIQKALAERAARLNINAAVATSTVSVPVVDLSAIQSPETYFGSNRNAYLGNGTAGVQGVQNLTLPVAPELNTLYLGGSWNIAPEYAESGPQDTVLFKYNARDVYIVGANSGASVTIKVLMDGKPVGAYAGIDVDPNTSEAMINGDRLYRLIHDTTPGVHTIEIQVEKGTLDLYTFTFG